MVYNLAKGIPCADGQADAIYHSHFLEHLERGVARTFMIESRRALKVGGVLRIVVPNFEEACREYIADLERCDTNGQASIARHEIYIEWILEQSVRFEASGTSQQKWLRRKLENLILGNARRRGETHLWMYDRYSLPALLKEAGFSSVQVVDYQTSSIAVWNNFGLDTKLDGTEYKPGSLYVEAIK